MDTKSTASEDEFVHIGTPLTRLHGGLLHGTRTAPQSPVHVNQVVIALPSPVRAPAVHDGKDADEDEDDGPPREDKSQAKPGWPEPEPLPKEEPERTGSLPAKASPPSAARVKLRLDAHRPPPLVSGDSPVTDTKDPDEGPVAEEPRVPLARQLLARSREVRDRCVDKWYQQMLEVVTQQLTERPGRTWVKFVFTDDPKQKWDDDERAVVVEVTSRVAFELLVGETDVQRAIEAKFRAEEFRVTLALKRVPAASTALKRVSVESAADGSGGDNECSSGRKYLEVVVMCGSTPPGSPTSAQSPASPDTPPPKQAVARRPRRTYTTEYRVVERRVVRYLMPLSPTYGYGLYDDYEWRWAKPTVVPMLLSNGMNYYLR